MVIGQLFMLHAFVGTWIGGRAYISYAVLVLHCTRIFSQLLYLQESDEDDGPMPVRQLDELQGEGERGVNYGGALLPGEGAAIAQFVQKGLRIPRRGEVGWAGQEIERLEDSG